MKRASSKAKRQAVGRSLHPVVGIPNLETYVPGHGCQCEAWNESECGCTGVDWTPREVYRLRAVNREAVKILKALLYDMPYPNCEWLHHRKADQNHAPTACPVEDRINAAVERARLFIRNSNTVLSKNGN